MVPGRDQKAFSLGSFTNLDSNGQRGALQFDTPDSESTDTKPRAKGRKALRFDQHGAFLFLSWH